MFKKKKHESRNKNLKKMNTNEDIISNWHESQLFFRANAQINDINDKSSFYGV